MSNATTREIEYAKTVLGLWYRQQPYPYDLDQYHSGHYNCLALDKSGNPFIAFFSSIE